MMKVAWPQCGSNGVTELKAHLKVASLIPKCVSAMATLGNGQTQ